MSGCPAEGHADQIVIRDRDEVAVDVSGVIFALRDPIENLGQPSLPYEMGTYAENRFQRWRRTAVFVAFFVFPLESRMLKSQFSDCVGSVPNLRTPRRSKDHYSLLRLIFSSGYSLNLRRSVPLQLRHSRLEKRHRRLIVGSLSLIDRNCSFLIVNATEGGIPKSSRLGRSLKSLAFMRVCPKARCG